jgi:hypothetical protein
MDAVSAVQCSTGNIHGCRECSAPTPADFVGAGLQTQQCASKPGYQTGFCHQPGFCCTHKTGFFYNGFLRKKLCEASEWTDR